MKDQKNFLVINFLGRKVVFSQIIFIQIAIFWLAVLLQSSLSALMTFSLIFWSAFFLAQICFAFSSRLGWYKNKNWEHVAGLTFWQVVFLFSLFTVILGFWRFEFWQIKIIVTAGVFALVYFLPSLKSKNKVLFLSGILFFLAEIFWIYFVFALITLSRSPFGF